MTTIGFIGLGKLGLPCVLAIESQGYEVVGYDTNPQIAEWVATREVPYREEGLPALLQKTKLDVLPSVEEVVRRADYVFVAVQTPHSPKYEGVTPIPSETRDFEYAYLTQAVRSVTSAAKKLEKLTNVVVVSTVLPGTFNNHLRPLRNEWIRFSYNPAFIAMGTAVNDFLHPEFVLIGTEGSQLEDFYQGLVSAPVVLTSIETAELVKVAYNGYLGAKIAFGNSVMEICHKTGADCDAVIDALSLADRRLMSSAYMRGGMGDGGACHPRDLIAMSHLAEKLDLSYDFFGSVMQARESQTQWLADLATQWSELTRLPIVVLGQAYKPNTDLDIGSPSRLLHQLIGAASLLEEPESHPKVYVIGCKHDRYREAKFATGSVVIDPWGYIPDRQGVTVVRVGRK